MMCLPSESKKWNFGMWVDPVELRNLYRAALTCQLCIDYGRFAVDDSCISRSYIHTLLSINSLSCRLNRYNVYNGDENSNSDGG